MNRSWLLTLCLLAFPIAGGAAGHKSLESIRSLFDKPAVPFAGEIKILSSSKGSRPEVWNKERIWFISPSRYRRELLDASGGLRRLVVADGEEEWVHDYSAAKVWKGEPAKAFLGRLRLDEEPERLEKHYKISVSKGARVAGRRTRLVELTSRSDARLSRRLWIDSYYGVVLRSQSFGPDGSPVSETVFVKFRRIYREPKTLFKFKLPRGVTVVGRMDHDPAELERARKSAGFEPKTPSWLPSGYVFEGLKVLPYSGKKIIHYRYTDGTDVLSLFQCPSRVRLDFGNKAREKVRLASGKGFISWTKEGQVLGWKAGGSRLVLVGSPALSALKRVAESIQ